VRTQVSISFDSEGEAAEWLRVARLVGALAADARVVVARMAPPPEPEAEAEDGLHEVVA
jgi:hypothetical protein